jgi:hypothetical protein
MPAARNARTILSYATRRTTQALLVGRAVNLARTTIALSSADVTDGDNAEHGQLVEIEQQPRRQLERARTERFSGCHVREVEPDEPESHLRRLAHQVMVIRPNDRDDKVADGIADPGWPFRQECAIPCCFRWPKVQDEYCDEDGEHAVAKRDQALWIRAYPKHARLPQWRRGWCMRWTSGFGCGAHRTPIQPRAASRRRRRLSTWRWSP